MDGVPTITMLKRHYKETAYFFIRIIKFSRIEL